MTRLEIQFWLTVAAFILGLIAAIPTLRRWGGNLAEKLGGQVAKYIKKRRQTARLSKQDTAVAMIAAAESAFQTAVGFLLMVGATQMNTTYVLRRAGVIEGNDITLLAPAPPLEVEAAMIGALILIGGALAGSGTAGTLMYLKRAMRSRRRYLHQSAEPSRESED